MPSELGKTIDAKAIKEQQKKIVENSDLINEIVSRLVDDYCFQLDELMEKAYIIVSDIDKPPTDAELDYLTLNIPILLYFTGEAQEMLGVEEDVAKSFKQELYNSAFEKATGTIADKSATAELKVMTESITHIAYQRAYKQVKLRMESASDMLQSVKKVMTRRITEYELSRVNPDRIGGR